MIEETTNILLVEDSLEDAEFFAHAFAKVQPSGRLHLVRDGAEALEFIYCTGRHNRRVPPNRPNVIVLDLKLPKVSGLEALRRFKQDPSTRDIPVIVLSSSQEEKDVTTSYELGANSFLVKPMGFDDFSRCVLILSEYWLKFNKLPKH